MRLTEKRNEGLHKFIKHPTHRLHFAHGILSRTWQHRTVIYRHSHEKCRKDAENRYPPCFRLCPRRAHMGCQHHQRPLAHNHRDAVEQTADANKQRLLVVCQSKHIKTVGGDIMGGRSKSHKPEHRQCRLEKSRRRQRKRYRRHRHGYQPLHHQHPPALSADDIHKRTPERLDNPRQIKPRGEKRQFRIAYPKAFIHNRTYRHNRHIWQPLCKIKSRHPPPWRPPGSIPPILNSTLVHQYNFFNSAFGK